jgi:hypothetical protein
MDDPLDEVLSIQLEVVTGMMVVDQACQEVTAV